MTKITEIKDTMKSPQMCSWATVLFVIFVCLTYLPLSDEKRLWTPKEYTTNLMHNSGVQLHDALDVFKPPSWIPYLNRLETSSGQDSLEDPHISHQTGHAEMDALSKAMARVDELLPRTKSFSSSEDEDEASHSTRIENASSAVHKEAVNDDVKVTLSPFNPKQEGEVVETSETSGNEMSQVPVDMRQAGENRKNGIHRDLKRSYQDWKTSQTDVETIMKGISATKHLGLFKDLAGDIRRSDDVVNEAVHKNKPGKRSLREYMPAYEFTRTKRSTNNGKTSAKGGFAIAQAGPTGGITQTSSSQKTYMEPQKLIFFPQKEESSEFQNRDKSKRKLRKHHNTDKMEGGLNGPSDQFINKILRDHVHNRRSRHHHLHNVRKHHRKQIKKESPQPRHPNNLPKYKMRNSEQVKYLPENSLSFEEPKKSSGDHRNSKAEDSAFGASNHRVPLDIRDQAMSGNSFAEDKQSKTSTYDEKLKPVRRHKRSLPIKPAQEAPHANQRFQIVETSGSNSMPMLNVDISQQNKHSRAKFINVYRGSGQKYVEELRKSQRWLLALLLKHGVGNSGAAGLATVGRVKREEGEMHHRSSGINKKLQSIREPTVTPIDQVNNPHVGTSHSRMINDQWVDNSRFPQSSEKDLVNSRQSLTEDAPNETHDGLSFGPKGEPLQRATGSKLPSPMNKKLFLKLGDLKSAIENEKNNLATHTRSGVQDKYYKVLMPSGLRVVSPEHGIIVSKEKIEKTFRDKMMQMVQNLKHDVQSKPENQTGSLLNSSKQKLREAEATVNHRPDSGGKQIYGPEREIHFGEKEVARDLGKEIWRDDVVYKLEGLKTDVKEPVGNSLEIETKGSITDAAIRPSVVREFRPVANTKSDETTKYSDDSKTEKGDKSPRRGNKLDEVDAFSPLKGASRQFGSPRGHNIHKRSVSHEISNPAGEHRSHDLKPWLTKYINDRYFIYLTSSKHHHIKGHRVMAKEKRQSFKQTRQSFKQTLLKNRSASHIGQGIFHPAGLGKKETRPAPFLAKMHENTTHIGRLLRNLHGIILALGPLEKHLTENNEREGADLHTSLKRCKVVFTHDKTKPTPSGEELIKIVETLINTSRSIRRYGHFIQQKPALAQENKAVLSWLRVMRTRIHEFLVGLTAVVGQNHFAVGYNTFMKHLILSFEQSISPPPAKETTNHGESLPSSTEMSLKEGQEKIKSNGIVDDDDKRSDQVRTRRWTKQSPAPPVQKRYDKHLSDFSQLTSLENTLFFGYPNFRRYFHPPRSGEFHITKPLKVTSFKLFSPRFSSQTSDNTKIDKITRSISFAGYKSLERNQLDVLSPVKEASTETKDTKERVTRRQRTRRSVKQTHFADQGDLPQFEFMRIPAIKELSQTQPSRTYNRLLHFSHSDIGFRDLPNNHKTWPVEGDDEPDPVFTQTDRLDVPSMTSNQTIHLSVNNEPQSSKQYTSLLAPDLLYIVSGTNVGVTGFPSNKYSLSSSKDYSTHTTDLPKYSHAETDDRFEETIDPGLDPVQLALIYQSKPFVVRANWLNALDVVEPLGFEEFLT